MPSPKLEPLVLSAGERQVLEGWARRRKTSLGAGAAIRGSCWPSAPKYRPCSQRCNLGPGRRRTAVVTTHAKALTSATPGDTTPGGKAIVYLVTIKGNFVCNLCSVPPGGHAPTGTYLSLVIAAKTFEGTDSGIGPKPPPVPAAHFGPVTYLKVRHSHATTRRAHAAHNDNQDRGASTPRPAPCSELIRKRSEVQVRGWPA
jgi:hypothetical protein